MSDFPCPIEGSNNGDGSPLVLGDEQVVGDLFCVSTTIHVLDWDGDGNQELVGSGGTGTICSFKFIGKMTDGTPIVDRGLRWGLLSRRTHIDEKDRGLTGQVIATGDFNEDGNLEVILAPRGYSQKPTVVFSLKNGAPTDRNFECGIGLKGNDTPTNWGRGNIAAIDWNGDNRLDLLVMASNMTPSYGLDPETGIAPEDQRDRYHKDGQWLNDSPNSYFDLYRNTSSNHGIEFTYAGRIETELPRHAKWISVVNPDEPKAGLLILGFYGDLWHLPLLDTGDTPIWGNAVELFTLHNEPFNRSTNMETSIGVSDVFQKGRFDIFASDKSNSIVWLKYHGQDLEHRPVYDSPRKVKQSNPHVNGGQFSVVTTGDWRDTGMPDLLVGSVEGYIFWYKTLSTNPLRFARPERVRQGTTEIRRLARANPSAGHHWGGSQSPYDGDTGGYSNPVLIDWNGNGLLDLIVSDMIGLYDWYPNWGNKTTPELGPPQRLHLVNGEPLFGPWRQQPGIGQFSAGSLPDIVIQDTDLDLALFRRASEDDLSTLMPGEKLRYEDGETIKTHGIYTPGGGDGRGRTKLNIVDWDGDGLLDLLIGVGPQHGSPYRGSYVLFAKNVGSNENPVFRRPHVLLWDTDGRPLEFWRHGVHMAPVNWDNDGRYALIAGADQGFVWYWKSQHFGNPANNDPSAQLRPGGEEGVGHDE